MPAHDVLIPFAVPLPGAGRSALQGLLAERGLGNLAQLLRVLEAGTVAAGSETSLSPPHEHALARALGWQGDDGRWPTAAWLAAQDGIGLGQLPSTRGLPLALVTPVHCHVGTEQVSLTDPDTLLLDTAESRATFDALHGLFVGDGYTAAWGAPLRWYIAHESLAGVPTAALDRVIGRNIDAWLGNHPAARRLHRLQSEVQLLLHRHPLTEARGAAGLPLVNSVWISGCGAAQPATGPDAVTPQVPDLLRTPALNGDWAAWAKAWAVLDKGPLAALVAQFKAGQPVKLMLCGERGWRCFASPASPAGPLARLRAWASPKPAWPLLEPL